MNLQFALLARYGTPVVPLKEICEEFFGISPKTAMQKAAAATLPIPTFRALDSERAPMMVKLDDLGDYLNKRHQEAAKVWLSVNG